MVLLPSILVHVIVPNEVFHLSSLRSCIRSLAAELFSDGQEVILIIPLATILYHNILSLQGHPIAVLQRASATPPSNKEIQNSVKALFFGAKLWTMTEVFRCQVLISGCSYYVLYVTYNEKHNKIKRSTF